MAGNARQGGDSPASSAGALTRAGGNRFDPQAKKSYLPPLRGRPLLNLARDGPDHHRMNWVYLTLAAFFEIGWAVGLKYSDGFRRPLASTITIVCLLLSISLLGMAARSLPIGTAYAVWGGIGAVGTVLVGLLAFGETASPLRLACIALIVLGIAGLQLVESR